MTGQPARAHLARRLLRRLRALLLSVPQILGQTVVRVLTGLMVTPPYAWRLLSHRSAFHGAEVIVTMTGFGFGHTFWGPDMARRMFRGRRCVFVVLAEPQRHNPRVSALWPDITVLIIPVSSHVDGGRWALTQKYDLWVVGLLERLTRLAARLWAGRDVRIIRIREMYALASAGVPEAPRLSKSYRRLIAYFGLLRDVPVERVRLPEEWRCEIERRLQPVAAARTCCLYLRQKGLSASVSSDAVRRGSPVEEYLPAVRLLNERRYRVLVSGDVAIPADVQRQFGPWLVDAGAIGADKEIFDLYAAIEADILIGDNGGGLFPAVPNGTRALHLNAYPYGWALPNASVYYKILRDRDGRLVPWPRLFQAHAHDWRPAGMTEHANSADEIVRAVRAFLDDAGRGSARREAEAVALFPPYALIHHAAGAQLSPAFLETYGLAGMPGEPVAEADAARFARSYVDALCGVLGQLPWVQIGRAISVLEPAQRDGRQVFIVGNGGSAATASHMANDLVKGVSATPGQGLRAIALADNVALLTAIANDLDYSEVFTHSLATLGRSGDVLIAISASGKSPNVVRAVEKAQEMGMTTIGFLGMGGGKVGPLVDVPVIVPSHEYGPIEDVHMIFDHLITAYLSRIIGGASTEPR